MPKMDLHHALVARDMTVWLLCAGIIFATIWDIAALYWGGYEATITRVVSDAARKYPVIPFALGWLLCHLLRA